jgi:hypothetical protein
VVGSPCLQALPEARSGLLGDAEYDYDADPHPQRQVVPWVPPPPEEEEEVAEEVVEASALSVELYQPPDLSEEEALWWAIEESELVVLGNWEGLGAQLATSAFTSRSGASSSDAGASSSHAAPPPPPPSCRAPALGNAVWESPPRAPPI